MENVTSYNNDYAVHSFASLSHSPTFASGTLSAYFTTGKRRIVMDVVRQRKICYNIIKFNYLLMEKVNPNLENIKSEDLKVGTEVVFRADYDKNGNKARKYVIAQVELVHGQTAYTATEPGFQENFKPCEYRHLLSAVPLINASEI